MTANNSSDILHDFKELPLWRQFSKENQGRYNFDDLFADALQALDQYYKAFPKYTLHNRQHVKNIIRIIGELVGEKVTALSDLECALIILSAVYHDIGMVFSDKELSAIEKEESFKLFLDNNFKAQLIYQENDTTLTKDLAEWYCRWMHARRVWLKLDQLDRQKWGNTSLRDSLGHICESHNDDASTLNDPAVFKTDFLGKADLRFCAVLLRLGDILDFDNTRTPLSVYELLDLDNPKNKNEEFSKKEWNKHLCSDGFIFSHEPDLALKFIAGPQHPQIEKNIQTFLDVIEDELRKCSTVISSCSKRWRDFRLPLSIDRTDIQSHNYKKGDYRLSLDENKITQLLVGEGLYDTKFVFIRELLQNAIDTSRMREYHEHSNSNTGFKVEPITIRSWLDKEGSRWVRIDDYGMGMNEYVIVNHLLKKGNSYYASDYFKIQKNFYKSRAQADFTPISRFGIGLLSCFMMGDAIEINTRAIAIPRTGAEEERIRISIQGLQGQYFMQTEKLKHSPVEMPNEAAGERQFRKEYGTSIAVRIGRNKDRIAFNSELDRAIKVAVVCSPVPILWQGEEVGASYEELISTPLAQPTFYPFSNEEKDRIAEAVGFRFKGNSGVELLLIDITATSANPNLKGQIVFFRLKTDEEELPDTKVPLSYSFEFSKYAKAEIILTTHYFEAGTSIGKEKKIGIDITPVFDRSVNQSLFYGLFRRYDGHIQTRFKIVHNGIVVPNEPTYRDSYFDKLRFIDVIFPNDTYSSFRHGFVYFGILYLQDDLMPDLAVARNSIRRIGFTIYSALFYSCRMLNDLRSGTFGGFYFFDDIDETFTFEEIKNDLLVKNGTWDQEKLFSTEQGWMSVEDIKSYCQRGDIQMRIKVMDVNPFKNALQKALLQLNFELELESEGKDLYIKIKSVLQHASSNTGIDKFEPLLFIPFSDLLVLTLGEFINARHFFGEWILENVDYLMENFEGYLKDLLQYVQSRHLETAGLIIDHFRAVLPEDRRPNFLVVTKEDYQDPIES